VQAVAAARRIGRHLVACCCALWVCTALADVSAVPLTAFPRERIAVDTRSAHRHLFEAWRADNGPSRAQGLMFVPDEAVRPDQAMIFVYDSPQRVTMWMKNTLLSLDMLFVDAGGCIVTVVERAEPGSLATIDSRVPVLLVVELKAGTVQAGGIRLGDRVVRLDAGWPSGQVTCTPPN